MQIGATRTQEFKSIYTSPVSPLVHWGVGWPRMVRDFARDPMPSWASPDMLFHFWGGGNKTRDFATLPMPSSICLDMPFHWGKWHILFSLIHFAPPQMWHSVTPKNGIWAKIPDGVLTLEVSGSSPLPDSNLVMSKIGWGTQLSLFPQWNFLPFTHTATAQWLQQSHSTPRSWGHAPKASQEKQNASVNAARSHFHVSAWTGSQLGLGKDGEGVLPGWSVGPDQLGGGFWPGGERDPAWVKGRGIFQSDGMDTTAQGPARFYRSDKY